MTAPAGDVGAGPELPDAAGHFGAYGGRFVPEALVAMDQPGADGITVIAL